jgi:hypothetical protein
VIGIPFTQDRPPPPPPSEPVAVSSLDALPPPPIATADIVLSPLEAGDTHVYVPATVNSTLPVVGGGLVLVSLIVIVAVVAIILPVVPNALNETLHVSLPSDVASAIAVNVNATNVIVLSVTVKLPLSATKSEAFVVL